VRIAVTQTGENSIAKAGNLAAKLGLPLIDLAKLRAQASAIEFDYVFAYETVEQGLRLGLQSTAAKSGGALSVDFSDAKLNYRANSSIKNQNIAKAVGVKAKLRPSVLDATAGLGKDAFLLAGLGCEIVMLERSNWVHTLLQDGLYRMGYYSADTVTILKRMTLHCADFLEFDGRQQQFDVVYLDPMFPERRKSAKVKKDMAMLQQLLGHQADAEDLLAHARSIARKRVVVKRAKLSPSLGASKPDIEFKGSSSRYDVYLTT
jgi:16S rRNA (guanine1516-N2)-methyltransferase